MLTGTNEMLTANNDIKQHPPPPPSEGEDDVNRLVCFGGNFNLCQRGGLETVNWPFTLTPATTVMTAQTVTLKDRTIYNSCPSSCPFPGSGAAGGGRGGTW